MIAVTALREVFDTTGYWLLTPVNEFLILLTFIWPVFPMT